MGWTDCHGKKSAHSVWFTVLSYIIITTIAEYYSVVQWLSLWYQNMKLNIREQWFEPCVVVFFLFIILLFFLLFFSFIKKSKIVFFSFCFFNSDFPLLVGSRLGRVIWVGQGPAVLAAGRWWRLFEIISRVLLTWQAMVRSYYVWTQHKFFFQC